MRKRIIILLVLGAILLSCGEPQKDPQVPICKGHALVEEQTDILFIGDSITCLGDWNTWFIEKVQNAGVGSDTAAGVLNRLPAFPATQKAVLLIGINDVGTGGNPLYKYPAIVDGLKSIATQVYCVSILPVSHESHDLTKGISNAIIAITNNGIQKICEDRGAVYINAFWQIQNGYGEMPDEYTIDGLHLSPKGYAHLVEIYKNTIQ